MDDLKNFAANHSSLVGVLKSRIGIRALVSHVLGSRASKVGTVATDQVQLGIGVMVQL